MKNYNTIFSKNDLNVFVLLFCAKADFVVSQSEYEYIAPKIGVTNFKILYNEICRRNDYQIINKIQCSIKNLNYSKEDKENLYKEIKEMYRYDTSNYNLKQNLYLGLKRILS